MQILYPENNAKITLANEFLTAIAGNYAPGCAERYNTKDDRFSMQGITLRWTDVDGFNAYMVCLSMKKDLSDGVEFYTCEPQLHLKDLWVNTQYFWQAIATNAQETKRSPIYTFTTVATPRTIDIEGVSNTRDLGGKNLLNGKQFRQGMVYRGGKLDEITMQGKISARGIYGIKTDLDLRNFAEGSAGKFSPLGEDIRYIHINGAPYYLGGETGIDAEKNKSVLASALKTFANPDNYPIYVHCSLGRDRTAAVCLLLEGLLGVSKRDIMVDYETSFLSKMGSLDGQTAEYMQRMFSATYDYIFSYAPDDFSLACESYLLKAGITAEEISTIRQLLII